MKRRSISFLFVLIFMITALSLPLVTSAAVMPYRLTLHLEVEDPTGESKEKLPLKGGVYSLYKVASGTKNDDGGYTYTLENDFTGSGVTQEQLDGLDFWADNGNNSNLEAMASKLAKYANAEDSTAKATATAATGEKGDAYFTIAQEDAGLYLAVCAPVKKAFGAETWTYTPQATLVSLPFPSKNRSSWSSSVKIRAKITTPITVTKVWEGDGDHPDSVTAQLFCTECTESQNITLNAQNEWTHTWTVDLGHKWQVKETNIPDGYTVGVTKKDNNFTITNTPIPKEEITVTKVWKGNKEHPDSVIATLSCTDSGCTESQEITLSTQNKWTKTVTVYTGHKWQVAEKNIPEGYTAEVTKKDNNFTITNTSDPVDEEITITKVWEGDKKHPDSVTVQLFCTECTESQNIVLNEQGNWTKKVTVELGHKWQVKETEVPEGYTAKVTLKDNQFTITNTPDPEKPKTIDISVKKVWEGDDDHPDSVTAQLFCTECTEFQNVTLNAQNKWTHTWTVDPEHKWQVKELSVPDGYTAKVTQKDNTFTITNTPDPERPKTIDITVTKVWEGGGDHPDSVTAQLFDENNTMVRTAVLNDTNKWSFIWTEVEADHTWRVAEETVPTGYTATVSQKGNVFTIKNTPVSPPDKQEDITVKKVWKGGSNHPDSVTVQLLCDGDLYGEQVLNSGNGWNYTWTVTVSGHTWSVKEVNVPDGYTCDVAWENNVATITNTFKPTPGKPEEITVKKVWKGGNTHPDSVTVQLFCDGDLFGEQALSNDNGWNYSWTADISGHIWSVAEINVPDGYTFDVAWEGNVATVTNTFTPSPGEQEQITVKKVWKGGSDHPDSVTVQLLCDGELFGEQVLSSSNDWNYTWTASLSGHTWSVLEVNIPDGYTFDVAWGGNTATVTNTRSGGQPSDGSNPPDGSDSPNGPTLPQTSQLWWPVPLLAAAGVLLLLIGTMLFVRKEEIGGPHE